jgi:hypothetical protein
VAALRPSPFPARSCTRPLQPISRHSQTLASVTSTTGGLRPPCCISELERYDQKARAPRLSAPPLVPLASKKWKCGYLQGGLTDGGCSAASEEGTRFSK